MNCTRTESKSGGGTIIKCGRVRGWAWYNSSVRTSVSIQELFRELRQFGVRIREQNEVSDYLLRFPSLIDTVRRATEAASKHLPEAQLSLELYQDPESEDEHLVLYARFPQYEEDVMSRIRKARNEYRPFLGQDSGYLLLTTDFRHPEP